jgi:transcriptional regulator with XRE-family HTH domain
MRAKGETDTALEIASEQPRHSFIERMEQCAAHVGSVSELARRAGISQSGIRRYFSGGEPTRPHLIALAHAADVSLNWLATGRSEPGTDTADSAETRHTGADLDALETIVRKVLTQLELHRPDLSNQARARIVRLIYALYLRHEVLLDDASLDSVIELTVFR